MVGSHREKRVGMHAYTVGSMRIIRAVRVTRALGDVFNRRTCLLSGAAELEHSARGPYEWRDLEFVREAGWESWPGSAGGYGVGSSRRFTTS